MKQYKKPLMKIVELEKVDVLTASCPGCGAELTGEAHSVDDACTPTCAVHKSSIESTAE